MKNIKRWLKENLPENFKESKAIKDSFYYEKFGIVQSIWIERSDFLDGDDKWVIIFYVSAHDIFWPKDSEQAALIVAKLSVVDDQVDILERWDQITHWELFDFDGLKKSLDEVILPWLSWFSSPEVLIDYLVSLESLHASPFDSSAAKKFGTVLTGRLISPPRTRKYFNGAIASIYKSLGNYDLAIDHLIKHRDFVMNDHRPSGIVEFENDYLSTLEMIDKGIDSLKSK